MPAGYPAVTGVESTYGDAFTFEISDLRVAERLPLDVPLALGGGLEGFHLMPATAVNPPHIHPLAGKRTRRPSNIVPITLGNEEPVDVFYLGLDVTFVGTELGAPGMPENVDLEVRFFLEGYGTPDTPASNLERHEINIQPQIFADLNAVPGGGVADVVRHQLWVQVAEANLAIGNPVASIIEAPNTEPWDDLFNPDTVYRIAASVKIVDAELRNLDLPSGLGFIAGAAMQTIEAAVA